MLLPLYQASQHAPSVRSRLPFTSAISSMPCRRSFAVFTYRISQPRQIARKAGNDRQGNDLRNGIGVERCYPGNDLLHARHRGLAQEERFRSLLGLSFPEEE